MIIRGETKLVLLKSISFFKWDYLSVIQPWLMKAGEALDRWMPLSSSWRMATGHRSAYGYEPTWVLRVNWRPVWLAFFHPRGKLGGLHGETVQSN